MELSFIICNSGQMKIVKFSLLAVNWNQNGGSRIHCSVALVKFNTVSIISLRICLSKTVLLYWY